MTSTRTMLMKMCVSCLFRMSDEELGLVVPMLTSIAPSGLDDLSEPDELETEVRACFDAMPPRSAIN